MGIEVKILIGGFVLTLITLISGFSLNYGSMGRDIELIHQSMARIERNLEHEVDDIEVRLREVEGAVAVLRSLQGKYE